jgi:hypothetical protein
MQIRNLRESRIIGSLAIYWSIMVRLRTTPVSDGAVAVPAEEFHADRDLRNHSELMPARNVKKHR